MHGSVDAVRRPRVAAVVVAMVVAAGLLGAAQPVGGQGTHRLLLPVALRTSALPVSWTGTTNTGLPVAFEVAGTQVTLVALTVYLQSGGPTCSATVPFQIDGPIPITA